MKELVFIKPIHTEIKREESEDKITFNITNASDEYTYRVAYWRGFTMALLVCALLTTLFWSFK